MSLLDKRFACLSTPPPQVPPVITLQPQNVTVDEGTPWNVTSSATGATSSEWYKDGSPTGNTTDTFAGAGLVAESGSYFNRYTNAIGDTDTNTSTVTINPDVVPRVIIGIGNDDTQNYTAPTWNPNSDFRIKFKCGRNGSVGSGIQGIFQLGGLSLRMTDALITVYPVYNTSGALTFGKSRSTGIDEIDEYEVIGVEGSADIDIYQNGVLLNKSGTPTQGVNFAGAFRLGVSDNNYRPLGGYLFDFEIIDVNGTSNDRAWNIDQDPANSENSLLDPSTLTYNNIATGLPTREVFTESGNTLIGNNGTVLTIFY